MPASKGACTRAARGFLALALLAPTLCRALDGVDVLKLPVSAREMSLGSLSALSDGAEALFYNPAGINTVGKLGLTLTHVQLPLGTRLDALGVVTQAPEGWGRLGLSVLALTQPSLDGRDNEGRETGSFGSRDMVAGASWGGGLGGEGRLRAATTLKFVQQTIADAKASGLAADLGVQAGGLEACPNLLFGLSARNLGPKMRFIEESFSLPLALGGAVGYRVKRALLVQAGIEHRPAAKRSALGLGAELWLGQTVALRSGYLSLMKQPTAGSASSVAPNPLSGLGFGLGLKLLQDAARLDYAFTPGSVDLGNAHRVTLGLEFGRRDDEGRTAPRGARNVNWDNFWRRDGEGAVLWR